MVCRRVRRSGSGGGCASTFHVRLETGEIRLVKVARGSTPEDVSVLRREYQLMRRASELHRLFPRPLAFSESLKATGPDGGLVRGRAAILMERVCGVSLWDLMRSGCYLDDAQGKEVARQVLEQARVLAELGYCHHDIRPSNVMLDPFGGSARLIDLGSASRLEADDGVRIGGDYQRPGELSRPLGQPPSPLTDLYSVAATLRMACWGDLLSEGEVLPRTPFSLWVQRVLADGFATPAEALRALS